jgi:hypothetical protein
LLVLLLGCGAVIVTVAVLGYQQEPRYKGRTSREWAEVFEMGMDDGATPAGTLKGREAMEAFRQMRKRVLPCAVRLLRYEKPEWKKKVEGFMELRMNVRSWAPRWIWAPFSGNPADEAVIYFRMLGGDGSPAIPELEALATDPTGRKSAGRAVQALGEIGLEALPALARVTTNVQATTRLAALLRINCLGSNAAPVAPFLLVCLGDADWRIAGNAAEIVGKLRCQPETSVPGIAKLLGRPEPVLRKVAVLSLAEFGQEARAAVPSLLDALHDPDFGVRLAATNALHGIAPEVLQIERPPSKLRD